MMKLIEIFSALCVWYLRWRAIFQLACLMLIKPIFHPHKLSILFAFVWLFVNECCSAICQT